MHAKNDATPFVGHSKAVLGCLLVAGLFSAGSWIWLAWTSRGVNERWSTATGTFADKTLGKLVNVSLPTHRKPSEQLDYWRPRLERILAGNPDDAELFAAAAPSEYYRPLEMAFQQQQSNPASQRVYIEAARSDLQVLQETDAEDVN